jgi:8-oxo-dGTP diphosphatase
VSSVTTCRCDTGGLKEAVVVAVRRPNGRWLQIVRSQRVPAPGRVGFVGGKVDEGETLQQAAVRETREEVGAAIDAGEVLGCGEFRHWDAHTTLVSAKLVGDHKRLAVNQHEVAQVLWLTADELASHPDRLESNEVFAPLLPA